MLKVYKECCNNCLLSDNRIVSPKRVKEIIQDCSKKQTHFICHKASIEEKEIIFKKFYDSFGYKSQMVRIAERLNSIEFIKHSDSEKFTTYKEFNSK